MCVCDLCVWCMRVNVCARVKCTKDLGLLVPLRKHAHAHTLSPDSMVLLSASTAAAELETVSR